MFIRKISNLDSIKNIDATRYAKNLALKKGRIFYFLISDLGLSATHILKQEALSVGGEFLLPKNSILCEEKTYSGILIATQRSLEQIIAKCAIQPFGLKKVANILQSHIECYNRVDSVESVESSESMESADSVESKNSAHDLAHFKAQNRQIMGIINITTDSFYEDSRVLEVDLILQKINDFIESGATIIDIGGASSRPGSEVVESSVELSRIKEAILAIERENLTQKATFSIDSYNYETIRFCLERGFSIINDVFSLNDRRLLDLSREFDAKIVLMHNSLLFPHSSDIIQSVDEFFAQMLELLESRGIKRDSVILDIGFGFGKNASENLALIRDLAHFRHFGCDLLVGASRKRTIGEVTDTQTKDRLAGSLALHQIAFENGANIIRCHDVKAHIDMLKILQSLEPNDERC